ncbi:DUF397 domain-containing protein [Nocardiopsis sediminis]|uniref:DUF397 domain-containing protein n=1 Tax=Nocardiopsis sediminis TaxID=1778267 RepID=A0ABV8FTI2_9ACTN
MNIIASTWHKASYSKADTCVEAAYTSTGGAAIRDTQHRGHATLEFSAPEWRALLSDIDTL